MNSTKQALRWAGLMVTLVSAVTVLGADYDRNIEKDFQVNEGGKLILRADRGSIEITPGANNAIHVRVLRRVKGATQEQAEQLFANHELTFEQDGGTISIVGRNKKNRLEFGGLRRPNLEVRYEVSIPKKYNVDLTTSGGDIRLGDLDGNALTRTSSGSIHVASVSGMVESRNSGGDIVIKDSGGDLSASTSSGSIEIKNASGKADLSNSGGDIRLAQARRDVIARTSSGTIILGIMAQGVDAKNSGGDIRIESAGGDVATQTSSGSIAIGKAGGSRVNARNSGGDIHIAEAAGDVAAQTSSGTVRLGIIKGNAEVRNSGGNVNIDEAAGKLIAETSSGSIEISKTKGRAEIKNSGGNVRLGESGGETIASTSSGSIVIKLAKGALDVRNSGGKIQVDDARETVQARTSSGAITVGFGAAPKADCHLDVSGGNISITLPRNASLDIDAQAHGGSVVTQVPVTTTVTGQQKTGSLLGKINGGGPKLHLRASSGDIRLN